MMGGGSVTVNPSSGPSQSSGWFQPDFGAVNYGENNSTKTLIIGGALVLLVAAVIVIKKRR